MKENKKTKKLSKIRRTMITWIIIKDEEKEMMKWIKYENKEE